MAGGPTTTSCRRETLKGLFALNHSKMGGDEGNWLLVKVDDEHADKRRKPTTSQPESVLSGKVNEDFAE